MLHVPGGVCLATGIGVAARLQLSDYTPKADSIWRFRQKPESNKHTIVMLMIVVLLLQKRE